MAMFSQKTIEMIETAFKRVEADVARFKDVFDSATEDEKICLKFYYADRKSVV